MTLDELKIGESATVTYVGGSGSLRQHFLDMGLIPGSVVTLEKFAPMGDPMELRLRGYELSLRKDEASQIEIGTPYKTKEEETNQLQKKIVDHPGLGEDGKYHEKKSEHPLIGSDAKFGESEFDERISPTPCEGGSECENRHPRRALPNALFGM